MLFRKLYIEKTPDSKVPVINWYLILKTYDDVVKYMDLDSDLFVNSYLNLNEALQKSHIEGHRQIAIDTMINIKASSLKENVEFKKNLSN